MSETQTGGRADDGAPGPAEAEIQIYGGYLVKYRVDVEGASRPHVRISMWLGEDADHYRMVGTLVMLREEAEAFMREVAGADDVRELLPSDPDRLADVEGEMGGAVELAQTWAVMPGTITYADAARFMLDALGYGPGGRS